jgi:erythromycin esterase
MKYSDITSSPSLCFLAFLVCIYCSPALAQDLEIQGKTLSDSINKIKHLDINKDNFSDLEFLKEKIGSSRFVFLGEESHGAGTTMKMKGRLIRFLHEEMGFNVLAWESGAAPVEYADKAFMEKKFTAHRAAQMGIFWVWISAVEMQPFLKYLKKARNTDTPLINVGFDCQFSGEIGYPEFPKDIKAFFNSKKELVSSDIIEKLEKWYIDYYSYNVLFESQNAAKEAMETMGSLKTTLENDLSHLKEIHPQHEINYMRLKLNAMYLEFERYYKYGPLNKSSSKRLFARDHAMAKNFIYIAEELYPDEKIIVWAHSVHNMRNPTNATYVNHNYHETMGHDLWLEYGDDIYNVAFVSYDGAVSDNGYSKKLICYPAPPTALEWYFHHAGNEYAFLDVKGLPESHWFKNTAMFARFVAPYFYKAYWYDICDAFVYIKTAEPKTYYKVTSNKAKGKSGRNSL